MITLNQGQQQLDSLFLLIPLSIALVGLVAVLFLWAVRSGQFDDLEGPAHDILNNDEVNISKQDEKNETTTDTT